MKKLLFILITGSLSLPSFSRESQVELVTPTMDLVSSETSYFFTAPLVSNLDKETSLRTAIYETLSLKRQTSITALTIISAPFFKLGFYGAATVVVTSGFVIPSQNSDGSGFGLYVALASDGNEMALPEVALAAVTSRIGESHSISEGMNALKLNVNNKINKDFGLCISDALGRECEWNLFGV